MKHCTIIALIILLTLSGCSTQLANGFVSVSFDPLGTRKDVAELKAFDAQVLQAFKAQEAQLNAKFETLEK